MCPSAVAAPKENCKPRGILELSQSWFWLPGEFMERYRGGTSSSLFTSFPTHLLTSPCPTCPFPTSALVPALAIVTLLCPACHGRWTGHLPPPGFQGARPASRCCRQLSTSTCCCTRHCVEIFLLNYFVNYFSRCI